MLEEESGHLALRLKKGKRKEKAKFRAHVLVSSSFQRLLRKQLWLVTQTTDAPKLISQIHMKLTMQFESRTVRSPTFNSASSCASWALGSESQRQVRQRVEEDPARRKQS